MAPSICQAQDLLSDVLDEIMSTQVWQKIDYYLAIYQGYIQLY